MDVFNSENEGFWWKCEVKDPIIITWDMIRPFQKIDTTKNDGMKFRLD